jgi:hypothetical protein
MAVVAATPLNPVVQNNLEHNKAQQKMQSVGFGPLPLRAWGAAAADFSAVEKLFYCKAADSRCAPAPAALSHTNFTKQMTLCN